jgi:very-short-patch-repair endonuclease
VIEKPNPPQSPLVRGEAIPTDLEQRAPSPDKGRAGEGFAHEKFGEAAEGVSSRGSFISYNKNLRELARQNRKSPTSPEVKFWNKLLRNKSLSRYKFTRQKPLGNYIADFYCAELKLVIEIDGDSHSAQTEYDDIRTQHLNSLGIRVVRFTNAEILHNLDGVYLQLRELIG